MPSTPPEKKRLLVVLGAGGHTRQMLRLVELLGPDYDYSYVISKNDPVSADKIEIPGQIFYITQPREKIRGRTDGAFTVLRRMPISLWQAWWILQRTRPHAIFGAGPSLQIPIAVAAKMRGIPHIFIETASKIEFLSFTARLVYRFHLYQRFYVQWESLTETYPGTRYAGRLL